MAKFIYSINSTQLQVSDSQINSVVFFDIKRALAIHSASRLFGNGISLTSDNKDIEKFLNKWMEFNKFDDLMMYAEQESSFAGRAIITLDRSRTGEIIPSLITNEFFQNVIKFEIHPFGAKLIRKRVLGIQVFFVTET